MQKLSDLFKDTKQVEWTDGDVKIWSQEYLQKNLKSDNIYCEDFTGGVLKVRVPDATHAQVVMLEEYDLQDKLSEVCGKEVLKIRVSTQ